MTPLHISQAAERFESGWPGGIAVWCSSAPWKIAGVLTIAIVTMSAGVLLSRPIAARAGALEPQAAPDKEAPIPPELNKFVTEIERRLRGCHERIVDLARPLVENLGELASLRNQLLNQNITVSSAKANFGNATLSREVAEIAVIEYEEGIFKQDEAVAQTAIVVAQGDLKRAEDIVETSKERLAKIKAASNGSAADVAVEFTYAENVTDAERQVPRAMFALQQAISRLKVLQDYTKTKTVKELKSEVEKARGEELKKKADWELEQSKLKRLEAAIKSNNPGPSPKASSASLDRLFSLDEKIRGELSQLINSGKLDEGRRKVVLDLTKELEGVVDHIEAERAAAEVDRVKAVIHARAGRAQVAAPPDGGKVQASIPAEVSGFVAEFTRRLKSDHERMARLATPMLEILSGQVPLESDPAGQETRVEAAKVSLKSATLAREFAEVLLKEYSETTSKQEQADLEQELKQAQDDLKRAMQGRVRAIERFHKIQELSKRSATDLQLGYRFETGVSIAELKQNKAQLAIEQAKSKLKVLNEYTVHKRTKELRSEIERARSNELAKEATLELEQGKLRRLKQETKKKDLSPREQKLLASLEDAFAVDATIRTKLEQVTKNDKIDAGLQKETQDLANQLESTLDRAEAERAQARFDDLKKQIRQPPPRQSLFRSLIRKKPNNEEP